MGKVIPVCVATFFRDAVPGPTEGSLLATCRKCSKTLRGTYKHSSDFMKHKKVS